MEKQPERDERLQHAIDRIKNLDDSMKVNLKGKKYTMVAQRVQAFREAFGCGANVETEIVVCDDTKVIVKATVSVQRDGTWVPIATEFAPLVSAVKAFMPIAVFEEPSVSASPACDPTTVL